MSNADWKWKKNLEAFAVQVAGIQELIDSKNLDELQQLRADCDKATTTNCWCYTFQAAQIIKPLLDKAIARRNLKRARLEVEDGE